MARPSSPSRPATEATPLLPPATQETSFSTPSTPSTSTRQISPDLVRGILMMLMAMDHTSANLGAYPHGTGTVSESPTTPITRFSDPFPYVLRTSTHLCAGGFAMLMGMGVVYFAESRKQQMLSPWQQIKHYAVRAIAILVVNTLSCHLTSIISMGPHIWLFNIVLPALALDYFLAGVLYTGIIYYLEPALRSSLDGQVKQSASRQREGEVQQHVSNDAPSASTMKTHSIVNILLLILSAVVLWMNVWTSPNEGQCDKAVSPMTIGGSPAVETILGLSSMPEQASFAALTADPGHCSSMGSALWWLLFQSVTCLDLGIVSVFPPVGWLSFTIFGLIYGRMLLSPARKTSTAFRASTINLAFTIFFSLLFVSTRLLQYGNLSTDCINTQHDASQSSASANQYLTSWRAFFYIVKYPPSPAYAFFSLAGNFLLLYLFSIILSTSSTSPLAGVGTCLSSPLNPLLVYGTNPLFFYGAHFWAIKIVSLILPHLPFKGTKPTLDDPNKPGGGWNRPRPHVGLGWLYWTSVGVVLVSMYFACLKYGQFKRTRGRESVWRFL
ncbi:hypothetical protein BCV69DRAFT_311430 [Microstroma glucosiphilum]|uniref:Heparan-alpha-glucosaminide N-acetyltransferase catalytic domain-containing protein n=1 Tax=Pseudomicrostroma glucosiphilum TaxID=1684307 RepID=A0A316UA31_9BASI|nr:hypothetical protein BCV69DRAFT_311430 [Pseudomicrostroma glucosiphilum]PWN21698.1 hypothetical protein BCV69DRAFT_311430 [Pseudomicrostroma glucosiphilum]